MSIKYFINLFKSTKRTSIFLVLINFALFPLQIFIAHNRYTSINYESSKLYLVTILLFIESAMVAISLHADYLKKNRCDMILSVPDKRSFIMNTKLIFGYLQVFVCMLIPYVVGVVECAFYFKAKIGYLCLYFIYMLIIIAAWYLLIFLVNSISKNILDAVILNSLVIIFMLLFAIVIDSYDLTYTSLIYVANDMTTSAEYAVCENVKNYSEVFTASLLTTKSLVSLIVHVVIAIGAYFLGMYSIKKYKPETVEGPNENIFAYTLINPLLFGTCFGLVLNSINSFDFAFYAIFFILSFLAIMFVGERKIRFTKQSIISIGLLVIFSFVFFLIANIY